MSRSAVPLIALSLAACSGERESAGDASTPSEHAASSGAKGDAALAVNHDSGRDATMDGARRDAREPVADGSTADACT